MPTPNPIEQGLAFLGDMYTEFNGTKTTEFNSTARVGSIVSLGNETFPFYFLETEVTEKLAIGGTLTHALHQFAGGGRIIDEFGSQPKTLEFNGHMLSLNEQVFPNGQKMGRVTAVQRVMQLDDFWRSGELVKFKFDLFWWEGVVTEFEATILNDNEVTFRFVFEPLKDNLQTATGRSFDHPTIVVSPFKNLLTELLELADKVKGFAAFASIMATVAASLGKAWKEDAGAVILAGAAMLPGAQLVRDTITIFQSFESAFAAFTTEEVPQFTLDMDAAQPFETVTPDSVTSAMMPQTQRLIDSLEIMAAFMLDVFSQIGPDHADPVQTAQFLDSGYQLKMLLQRMLKTMAAMIEPADAPVKAIYNPDFYQLAIKYFGDITKWVDIATANGFDEPRVTDNNVHNIVIPIYEKTAANRNLNVTGIGAL